MKKEAQLSLLKISHLSKNMKAAPKRLVLKLKQLICTQKRVLFKKNMLTISTNIIVKKKKKYPVLIDLKEIKTLRKKFIKRNQFQK